MFENQIRESVVAGSFYSSDPVILKKTINKYIENAPLKNIENITSLVCPHAGYIYSGQVAACSYKQIKGKEYDCIFIIAPSHSEYFDFNSIFAGTAYQTPLGIVEVDVNRCKYLESESGYRDFIKLSGYGHRREHSLEVQLPFLQVCMSKIKIVPIVMGSQSKQNIESLGNSIGKLFKGQNILIVASTDLSHYHPYEVAEHLDNKVLQIIKEFDTKKFIEEFTADELEMCGGGPVAAAMIASKILGSDSSEILCYNNSGDVSGDKSAVVGYLAAAFYKSHK